MLRKLLAPLLSLLLILPGVPFVIVAAQAATIAQATTIVTRTNDTNAYGAGDVIGAATGSTAALSFAILPNEGMVRVMSTTLEIDAAAIIASETSYTLYLYSDTPPSALGDNAAWDVASGDRATFVGSLALGTPADIGSSLFIQTDNINKDLYLKTGTIYGYLVTTGGYTPTASRVFRIGIRSEVVGGLGSPN